jgi:hypothetical protein
VRSGCGMLFSQRGPSSDNPARPFVAAPRPASCGPRRSTVASRTPTGLRSSQTSASALYGSASSTPPPAATSACAPSVRAGPSLACLTSTDLTVRSLPSLLRARDAATLPVEFLCVARLRFTAGLALTSRPLAMASVRVENEMVGNVDQYRVTRPCSSLSDFVPLALRLTTPNPDR